MCKLRHNLWLIRYYHSLDIYNQHYDLLMNNNTWCVLYRCLTQYNIISHMCTFLKVSITSIVGAWRQNLKCLVLRDKLEKLISPIGSGIAHTHMARPPSLKESCMKTPKNNISFVLYITSDQILKKIYQQCGFPNSQLQKIQKTRLWDVDHTEQMPHR